MRWKFLNLNDPKESKFHAQMLDKIRAWWDVFQAQKNEIEAYLTNEKDWNIETWMDNALGNVSPGLMWEFGGDGRGSFLLVITPEAERHYRPLVRTVLDMAPKMPNWEFASYRQPQGMVDTQELVKEQTGLDAATLRAGVCLGEGNHINLLYASPDLDDNSEPDVINAAFLSTECLLGEEMLDRWIGAIEVTEDDDPSAKEKEGIVLVPLMSLPTEVITVLGNMVNALPKEPVYQFKDKLKPITFELDPEKSEDYPHRLDMVLASTQLPEMWKAAHSGVAFDSIRFSRVGERFCFLKMDGKDSYANSPASRDRVARTLDEKLMAAGLGCTIGGAGGLRYSYLDLALTDVDKAIPVIKEVLAYEHMPERSWLLFFDADWGMEWVGMFDNTPAPLMPELAAVQ